MKNNSIEHQRKIVWNELEKLCSEFNQIEKRLPKLIEDPFSPGSKNTFKLVSKLEKNFISLTTKHDFLDSTDYQVGLMLRSFLQQLRIFRKKFAFEESLLRYHKFPKTFNNHQTSNDYYFDEAKLMMEKFCEYVENKKDIPDQLNIYFKDCFLKVLKGGQSLERCFNFSGRKELNPYEFPDFLENVFSNIMEKEMSFTNAYITCQTDDAIDKDEKTIGNLLHKYSSQLFDNWLYKNIDKIKTHDDLTIWQKDKLKNSFKIDIEPVKDKLQLFGLYLYKNENK